MIFSAVFLGVACRRIAAKIFLASGENTVKLSYLIINKVNTINFSPFVRVRVVNEAWQISHFAVSLQRNL